MFGALLTFVLLAAPDLEVEAKRRTDVLISQHYNLTHGFKLDANPQRLEFFIPEEPGEHTFSFWGEAAEGELTFRLTGPDGQLRTLWSGKGGDSTSTAPLATGKYLLELVPSAGARGRAIFAVKGPVVRGCELDAEALHPAVPAQGFQWPYLLYVPPTVRSERLLVAPNNTGFATADPKLLELSASCELRRQKALADRLGTPLLIPLFPRPPTKDGEENLYLHALSRSSLETKVEAYRRVDLQLLAMIDSARTVLEGKKVKLKPEVLLWGFSASASFVSRFALLHPERVAAVASVSPGGWPIAPVPRSGADTLNYPVGIADLEQLTGRPLDPAALGHIKWLFCLGAKDDNDSVVYRDSFSAADEALVLRRFGKTPVARWKPASTLYAGLDAKFELYPGVSHQVSPEMAEDIARFFAKQ